MVEWRVGNRREREKKGRRRKKGRKGGRGGRKRGKEGGKKGRGMTSQSSTVVAVTHSRVINWG